MVAVFNKELLSWYLITIKLKETVESGLPKQEEEQSPLNHEQPETSIESPLPDPDWIISIREKLTEASKDETATSWAKLCTYRVPKCLREGDDKAYVPQVVSLGPYHRDKQCLREMERHKYRSLHQILKRTHQDLKLYLEAMQELEEKARACYEGTVSLSSNEFVKTMVPDGCFILELFRGTAEGFKQLGYSRNDPVFAMRGLMHSIQRELRAVLTERILRVGG